MNDLDLAIVNLTDADRRDLQRLAELDSTSTPQGQLLGARLAGRLVAAISIEQGSVIADPFVHTTAIVQLLELRRKQLLRGQRRRGRLLLRRPGRATLASSPPGGGGRLLSL